MSTATRPSNVPTDATLIMPGQSFPPGAGVQIATLKTIFAQDAHVNAQNQLRYQQTMQDYEINAVQCAAYHLRAPIQPPAPSVLTPHVIYANGDGTVVSDTEGADGMHYAWIWETWE